MRPYFEDLCFGLGWRANERVAMTWIYFDESGEHERTGGLKRLTLGCAIGSVDQWKAIDAPWRKVIADAGVDMFHMADFEARKPPFDTWDNPKRQKVLNQLLDLMCKNIPRYWGVSDFREDIAAVSGFKRAYEKNAIKLFLQMISDERLGDGPVTCVFAKHKNISAQWVGRFFDHFSHWMPGRLKFGGFGEPFDLPQLQIADIVSYEFSRTARKERPEKERYPLLRLAQCAEDVTLYHASRFGLDHYDWGAVPHRRHFESQV